MLRCLARFRQYFIRGLIKKVMALGKDLQIVHPTMPGRDLTAYMASVNGISVLTPEEEKDLANQYYYDDNVDAARQLVLAHLLSLIHISEPTRPY